MERRFHVHHFKFMTNGHLAYARALFKHVEAHGRILREDSVLPEKFERFTGEKEYRRFERPPLAFADESCRFECLEALLGRFRFTGKVQARDVGGSHDAGFEEGAKQAEVAVL